MASTTVRMNSKDIPSLVQAWEYDEGYAFLVTLWHGGHVRVDRHAVRSLQVPIPTRYNEDVDGWLLEEFFAYWVRRGAFLAGQQLDGERVAGADGLHPVTDVGEGHP